VVVSETDGMDHPETGADTSQGRRERSGLTGVRSARRTN